MRYSSTNNNPSATILRGPRGRTRVILGSITAGAHHQTVTRSPAKPKIKPVLLKERSQQHISIPTNQLVNQVIQQSAITESPSAY